MCLQNNAEFKILIIKHSITKYYENSITIHTSILLIGMGHFIRP
jgi:hypothetical protein